MRTCNLKPVGNPVRVLIAENHRHDSDLLVQQLRKSNLADHVKIILDGKEAWNFLTTGGSDAHLIAIFLDLNLPSLSGLKLLYRIKAHPGLHDTPIIVMTPTNTIEEMDECIRLGVDGFIAKPVTFSAFTKAVADVFQHVPAQAWTRSE